MSKKIITVLLSVVMVISVVMFAVSCNGSTSVETTANQTETAETTTKENVTTAEVTQLTTEETTTEEITTELTGREKMPGHENVDFGGLAFLIASNDQGVGDPDWDDSNEWWVESINNDAVNDAVYERNQVMEKLYNCTISVDNGGWANGFSADVASGGGKYIGATTLTNRKNLANSHYYNLLKLDFNFDEEWWNHDYINCFSTDGKLFTMAGDWSWHIMNSTWIVYYNKDVYESKFADTNIYQLVKEKKWTWDVMINMMEQIKNDVNGDSSYTFSDGADADILGMVTSEQTIQGWYYAAGLNTTTKSSDDYRTSTYVNSLVDDRNQDVVDKMITMCNLESYEQTGYSNVPVALKNKTTLFGGEVLDVLRRMSNAEDLRVGVLPMPLYQEGQERYYCYAQPRGISILVVPTSYKNLDVISQFYTLFAYHSTKLVYPAYLNTYRYTYTSDEESAEIVGLILDSVAFDFSNIAELQGCRDFLGYLATIVSNKKNQVVAAGKRYTTTLDASLNEYKEKVAAVDDNY